MTKRYFGITYIDFEIAEKNGIGKSTVESRVYEGGWDIDKAITTPVRKKKNNIAPYLEIAEKNGIKECTVRRRVERGWAVERAVTTPTMTNKEKLKKARESKKPIAKIRHFKKEYEKTENYFRKLNRIDFERMKNNVL